MKKQFSGYDIDGIITERIRPERDAVIITGRSYEEAPETYKMLRDKRIFNAVYFNPKDFQEKNPENAGIWKATMINLLGITDFWEDEEYQADTIKRLVPNIIIHLIKPQC